MLALSTLFKNFITDQSLIKTNDRVLVAVSGGVDSVVLCHLMNDLKIPFEIAHCNFMLRGEESDEDENFVRGLANELGVKLHFKSFDTQDHVDKTGISIQMAARELRYEWFQELLLKTDCEKLATAHHANDQVETVLFNLTKGTGISGMRGIEAASAKIIRPLLFVTKEEILYYANEHHLKWREDASNASDKYSRNLIRHQVIPHLKSINPSLEKTFFKNALRFSSLEGLLKVKTKEILNKFLTKKTDQFVLDMSWSQSEPGALAILEDLLKPFGFNLDQCLNILTVLGSESGRVFSSEKHELTVDRTMLFIESRKQIAFEEYQIHGPDDSIQLNNQSISVELISKNIPYEKDNSMAFLDGDKVSFPITVRSWVEGDRFQPLGMKNQKKVSDYMIDAKIPLNLKKKVLIFESNKEIIWVGGHRISERHKITPETTSSLVIKLANNA